MAKGKKKKKDLYSENIRKNSQFSNKKTAQIKNRLEIETLNQKRYTSGKKKKYIKMLNH